MRGTVLCLAFVCVLVGAAQPATPTEHAEKTCSSLDQAYELAQNGDAEAQCWLARQYEAGLCGLCKDDPLAVVWFKKAAEAGRAEAQFALGIRCFLGLGVPQNLEQAASLLHKAAQQGQAAANWFLRAAVQGYATAQYNLARSYETGDGLDNDREKALYWYGKAARQGDADAQARLDAF